MYPSPTISIGHVPRLLKKSTNSSSTINMDEIDIDNYSRVCDLV